jgi:uncharacterized low-complexity protein
MKNSKTSVLTNAIIAGAIAGLSSLNASASGNLFTYSSLGSGAELRSELLNISSPALKVGELECGKSKTTAGKKDTTKMGEHKCGEGKCGESKKGAKTSTTKTKTVEKTQK